MCPANHVRRALVRFLFESSSCHRLPPYLEIQKDHVSSLSIPKTYARPNAIVYPPISLLASNNRVCSANALDLTVRGGYSMSERVGSDCWCRNRRKTLPRRDDRYRRRL